MGQNLSLVLDFFNLFWVIQQFNTLQDDKKQSGGLILMRTLIQKNYKKAPAQKSFALETVHYLKFLCPWNTNYHIFWRVWYFGLVGCLLNLIYHILIVHAKYWLDLIWYIHIFIHINTILLVNWTGFEIFCPYLLFFCWIFWTYKYPYLYFYI